MPVKIRLARYGRVKKPFYRIAVANANTTRDGKALEFIGHYDPMIHLDEPTEASDQSQKTKFQIEIDRLAYWLGVGAQPTDRIKLFVSQSNDPLLSKFSEKYKVELEKKKTASINGPKKEKKKKS